MRYWHIEVVIYFSEERQRGSEERQRGSEVEKSCCVWSFENCLMNEMDACDWRELVGAEVSEYIDEEAKSF